MIQLCAAQQVFADQVINKELLRVAAVINNMVKKGANVTRHNLSSEPQAFVDNKKINEYLNSKGADILPITLVDGEVKKIKEYPTNEEFAEWSGLSKKEISNVTIKNLLKVVAATIRAAVRKKGLTYDKDF